MIRFNFDLNSFNHKSKQVTALGSEWLQNAVFKISLASSVGLAKRTFLTNIL